MLETMFADATDSGNIQNRLGIAIGSFAVFLAIVGPPFVALIHHPYEPPLRIGMKESEVKQVLGPPQWGSIELYWSSAYYRVTTDWMGNQEAIYVEYFDGRISSWESMRFPQTTPPWLAGAMKCVGL